LQGSSFFSHEMGKWKSAFVGARKRPQRIITEETEAALWTKKLVI
jgi:hypothetical protein